MSRFLRAALAAAVLLSSASALQAQLLIGQTAGFTGPVADGVKEITEGAKLWINAVNARGGVHGQKIELVSLDDKFEPKLAAENARKLEARGVLALFLTRGTPHNEAILPVLEAGNLALVAPSTGAIVLHQPVNRRIFNVRSTYQREAEKAIDHLVALGMNRIAVVASDDSFGADVQQGTARSFERARLKPVANIAADRARPDIAKIVPALLGAQAQAVVWIGSAAAVGDGVKALRAAGSAAQIVTLSNNASAGFVRSAGTVSHGVIVTQVFPNERSGTSALSREMAELAKAAGVETLSPAMLEGYAGAKVLVEGLRRAGRNPTRASVIAGLEAIQKFDLGGLDVTYSATDHTGLEFTELSMVGPDGSFRR
ncbi:MAG: amino acid ABC transporter substrate-binding protein [Comamonadaceae bacterium]|nr:MAG: amino acid ABC transporter substrate-binding protein [Comamonadaceae bacterium]